VCCTGFDCFQPGFLLASDSPNCTVDMILLPKVTDVFCRGNMLHIKRCSDSLRMWASLSIGALLFLRGTWCLRGRLIHLGTLKDG